MFNNIVNPKEIAPDKPLPHLFMVIIITSENEVDNVDQETPDDHSHHKIADQYFVACCQVRVKEDEDQKD